MPDQKEIIQKIAVPRAAIREIVARELDRIVEKEYNSVPHMVNSIKKRARELRNG